LSATSNREENEAQKIDMWELDIKKKPRRKGDTLLLRFVLFTGDSGCQRRCKKGRGEEAEPDPPIFCLAHTPPLFVKCQKPSQHCYEFWGVYFVNFKLFNLIFV
jgi:hypothetical protein